MSLTNLKLLLSIDVLDTTQDALLTVLKDYVQKRIMTYVGATVFPVALDWIADEVTIKRYNKLSAEGLLQEGISGIIHKFEDSLLAEFKGELDAYKAVNGGVIGVMDGRLVMR